MTEMICGKEKNIEAGKLQLTNKPHQFHLKVNSKQINQ